MAEMLSPGVYSTIIDASQIVPTTSTSTACFAGDFVKGPVGSYTLITDKAELVDYYGKPNNSNYNDFYQAYNFLCYGNTLLLSRAGNTNGSFKRIDGAVIKSIGAENDDGEINLDTIYLTKEVTDIKVGSIISFSDSDDPERYYVTSAVIMPDDDEKHPGEYEVELHKALPSDTDSQPQVGGYVYNVEILFNGSNEALDENAITTVIGTYATYTVPVDLTVADLFETNKQILNYDYFEEKESSIAFAKPSQAKIKFISRNPGTWCKNIKIAIAPPSVFAANDSSDEHVTHYAFEGLAVDDYFEYAPTGTQVGILIYDDSTDEVVETYTVDFNESAVDDNGKSTFIETVINRDSNYVYVKVNTSNTDNIADYTLVYDETDEKYVGKNLTLLCSTDSSIQRDDLITAYEVFQNKEELDVDIVIANELDGGASAKDLTLAREDCICFIGAPRDILVGKKSAVATQNLVKWRKGAINWNSKYLAAFGNYKYQLTLAA